MTTDRRTHRDGVATPVAVALTVVALFLALLPGGQPGLWARTALSALAAIALSLQVDAGALRQRLDIEPRTLLRGVGLGVVMAGLTHALYAPGAALWPALSVECAALYERLDAPPGRVAAIPIIALVVLAEELVFRGLAYDYLSARLPRAAAVTACTLIYALPQLGSGSWLLPLLALGCGAVWTLQRALGGTLTEPLLTHLTWDLAVLSLWPLSP